MKDSINVNLLQLIITILFIYVLVLSAAVLTWLVIRAIRGYLAGVALEKKAHGDPPPASRRRYGSKRG